MLASQGKPKIAHVPPEARKRHGRFQREHDHDNTLILDFWPPEL